ncbi:MULTISPECIES: hypothetical protein [Rhodopseudomonas]|uniref:Uncharacterized protein n=1 Tax=Rhodopseudomonas palustris TaxID=1076 RepID=A0A0D7DX49_RHOPL|nr:MULTISPECIES: hypothetical protein [Rhodopseudomonas]KIZ32745.1 hypothetical protein OO17_29435 [Rhodopseudomonas palustris]MDF3809919.1 hypothetical protein [Rhodopseudomonas sp. BAL398]WOK17839.1 hypothetical protein RBJ75_27620 [Rhodopseudomonas sp. BAL398]
MDGNHPISWLMFFTLAAGVVIVGLAFINFIRSRSNREIAAETLEGRGTGRGAAADGALPELGGLAVFALIAMGLLALGNNARSNSETAQIATPAASSTTTTGTGTGAASPTTQTVPRIYNRDGAAAPTASDTGIGAANGSTGQPK